MAALALLFCLGLVLAFGRAVTFFSGRADASALAASLVSGDPLPGEKKLKKRNQRRQGAGLPFKLILFMIVLVLLITGIIAAPLYTWMSRTRAEILFLNLSERVMFLLESLAAESAVFIQAENRSIPELQRLTQRGRDSIPSAQGVTITVIDGSSATGSGFGTYREIVLASSDPNILSKIDSPQLEPGISRLADIVSIKIEDAIGEWEGGRGAITKFNWGAGVEPPFSSGLPASTGHFIPDIFKFIFSRNGNSAGERQSYLFYRPIISRNNYDDKTPRLLGFLRFEAGAALLLEEIHEQQRGFIMLVLIVASVAIIIGAAGAVLLSSLIIYPIKRLVSHVELIRDTENMAAFEGMDIRIKSRDELALLGNTINDMTRGLVRAAQASQDLTIGKELQKKFIPLQTDREGNKLTTGFKETPLARFFGYYEGAKGVSGDYFDYQDLDGRYFALIKCDVAGKGVPAALIMIQVATMFLNYFNDWIAGEEGMHIEKAVYQINEFIEALGFSGRFAAFALCLFDSETGLLRFCNAGDNIVHFFDASEQRMKNVTLRETPAAGVLPNFLVDSRGGYTVQTMQLDHGDMLFLYTDGIEESKRKFRDEKLHEIICAETITGLHGSHGNHRPGQGVEEMGRERVEEIINAVMNKEKYYLRKYHNPEEEELCFDFSSSPPEVDEAVMALVSVEKVFRMFRGAAHTRGGAEDASLEGSVIVDRRVDEFLKKHFNQYEHYCSQTREYHENPGYMYYAGINEDPQYDDITILGIRRK